MKLVIAEKPSVAKAIAGVIGARNFRDGGFEGNGYYVTSAFGHLVGLADPKEYGPPWNGKWTLEALPILPKPMKLVPTGDEGALKRLALLKDLIGKADEVICATDAGREGEAIFRNIWIHCGGRCKASRLWISSLTNESIEKGMKALRPLAEFDNLAAAAEARAQADWMVGMNSTRGYSAAYNADKPLSIGRVQTPVLALIVARDSAIAGFRSAPFWELVADYRGGRFKRAAGRFEKLDDGKTLLDRLRGIDLSIDQVKETEKREKAPALYDLTELQRDGNKARRLEAKRTLEIVQALYERKHVTYPRTDSRFLSSDMVSTAVEAMAVAKMVIGDFPTGEITGAHRSFNDAKVSDHHAIIPTPVQPERFDSEDERWIYEAICRRLVAAFAPDCRKAVTEVSASVGDEAFTAKGTLVLDAGWRALYGPDTDNKEKEILLPKFIQGERGPCALDLTEGKTTPPKAYTEATLLTAMEQAGKEVDDEELKEALKERGLGTPATRAGIIETLAMRQFIAKEKGNVLSTERGRALIGAIVDPSLKSAEMTGEWEHKLKRIERGQLDAATFLNEVRTHVGAIIATLISTGFNAGLASVNERISIGKCPICKKPVHELAKSWTCEDRECQFVIWKEIAGKKIPASAAADLLQKGRSAVLKGFTSKAGKKFEAMLILKSEDHRVGFEFPERDAKKKPVGSKR